MSIDALNVIKGLDDVHQRIANICKSLPKELTNTVPTLVAVSKTKPIENMIELYRHGQRHFGENYIQELVDKAFNEEVLTECPDIKWHFIGHLQRNKVPKIINIPGLYVIETVDSEKLSSALDTAWSKLNKDFKLNIFVQVNTSQETEKNGVPPDDVAGLVKFVITSCPHLNFKGLMTIGKFGYDCNAGPNPDFICLKECRQNLCSILNLSSDLELSMGMSDDYEHAIQLGSTNVRVGSAIFGYREKKEKSSLKGERNITSLQKDLLEIKVTDKK